MLTTGRVNLNNAQIDSSVINWEMFERNPVLQYDKHEEGHRGVVIGKVVDRFSTGDGDAAYLEFMERFEDADIAWEKHSQGVLPYVSIGGFARGKEVDGVFVASEYMIREVSLVKFPANIDCAPINASELKFSERRAVKRMTKSGDEVRYLTMSFETNFENMEENEEKVVEASEDDVATEQAPETTESAETEIENTEAPSEQAQEVNAEDDSTPEEDDEVREDENSADDPEVEGVPVEASVEDTPVVEAAENPLPEGMQWHERNNTQQKSQKFQTMTFKELNCDAEFGRRLGALNDAMRMGASVPDNTPENVETMRMLAASMLADEKMVIIASRTHVTDAVSQRRKNGLQMLIECAAGPAADATLAAADLGVIKYMSLVYQQLFANDTFHRSVRFVPMSDREGAIYIESGINAPTYVGNVTPINAQNYFYDDIKRTIARRVFSFEPIVFQAADLAILAYDKQSLGIKMTMDRMMQDISTYWLQIWGNTAGLQRQGTTGDPMATAGLFPIEAPLSGVNINMPTRADLIALQGKFLVQNFNLNRNKIEMVLPANLYSALAQDEAFYNKLTRQNGGQNESEIDFQAIRVTPRNPVVRYNTATPGPELDPSLYADRNVADDGTFTTITPAVTTANHIGAGLAWVDNEVIAGIGSIDLIAAPDPNNYGYKISGWISTGATVARANSAGVALIAPTVSA